MLELKLGILEMKRILVIEVFMDYRRNTDQELNLSHWI